MSAWLRTIGASESFSNLTGHRRGDAGKIYVSGNKVSGSIVPGCLHDYYNIFRVRSASNSSFALPSPTMMQFEALFYFMLYPVYEPPHVAFGMPAAGNLIGVPVTAAQYAQNYPKQLGLLAPFLDNCLLMGVPGEQGIANFLHMAYVADGSLHIDHQPGDHREGTVFSIELHTQDTTKGLHLSLPELFAQKLALCEPINRALFHEPQHGGSWNGPTAHDDDGPRFRAVFEGHRHGTNMRRPTYAEVDKMLSDPNVALGGAQTPCIIIALDRDWPKNDAEISEHFLHRCVRFLDFIGPCACPSRTYKWCLGMGIEGQVPRPGPDCP